MVSLMAFSGGGHETNSTGGAPAGFAGDPFASSATCRSCHSGPTAATIAGIFTSNIPPAGYTTGSTYTITANFVRPGHIKFGFEATPQNASGTLLGTLAPVNANTQVIAPGRYITHTTAGTAGSGGKIWNFLWTAPAAGLGPVTFYGTFNATNNSGSDLGDSIFKSTLVVTENLASVNNYESTDFSLSTFPNPTSDILNVKFVVQERSSVEIDLFDSKGYNPGSLFSAAAMSGEVNQSFDISTYPKGIYFLRLNVEGNYALHKVVKM